MAERVEIPRDLADAVLFASDRQCCVCRDGNTRVQIHHIDENPGNNAFENLAVICLDHHSEVHSREAFVRNLSPGLVRQYNDSWRALVRLRVNAAFDPAGMIEYTSEVLLEFSLNCHAWKIHYMLLFPGGFREVKGGAFVDVWDMMIEMGTHRYSPSEWKQYLPLFEEGIRHLFANFDRTLSLYADVLPVPFKTLLVRTRRRLDTTHRMYLYLPTLVEQVSLEAGVADLTFKNLFTEALQAIRDISRDADRLRNSLAGAS